MKNKFFFKKKLSNIYKSPSRFSEVTSQILYGEKFKILSKNKNWLKIKTSFDNYIGYMRNNNYMDNYKPTHKIFKLKSKILIINKNKKFIEYEKNKWIQKKDLKTIDHIEKDYIKILKLFLKTKYIWGGKTYKGVDCSAILQLFFYYNDKFYPRDTKDQIRYSKKNSKMQKFKKGDIIFWNGHVALCLDTSKLIHAYGPKKKVLIMPINYTIKKIKKTANLTVKKISNILN